MSHSVTKPRRIVMHWTAGTHSANENERNRYHEIVEADGTRVMGNKLPEANNNVHDGNYAAHTRKFNTGAIGLAMAGMRGAVESPFRKGRYALTETQVSAFIDVVAEYADTYDIPIDGRHVLSHKEVHHTFGIFQDRWDIMWLPHMARPGHAVEVGDHLRSRIQDRYRQIYGERAIYADLDRDALIDEVVERLRG